MLIIQNDVGNKYSPTIIACAVTSRLTKAKLPTHIELREGESGLKKASVALLEQLRTLDKRRLKEKIGVLSSEKMERVDRRASHFAWFYLISGKNVWTKRYELPKRHDTAAKKRKYSRVRIDFSLSAQA